MMESNALTVATYATFGAAIPLAAAIKLMFTPNEPFERTAKMGTIEEIITQGTKKQPAKVLVSVPDTESKRKSYLVASGARSSGSYIHEKNEPCLVGFRFSDIPQIQFPRDSKHLLRPAKLLKEVLEEELKLNTPALYDQALKRLGVSAPTEKPLLYSLSLAMDESGPASIAQSSYGCAHITVTRDATLKVLKGGR